MLESWMGRKGVLNTVIAAAIALISCVVLYALPSGAGATTSDSCGYDASTFTESTVMRWAQVDGSGNSAQIVAFANDEKGLLLGVNGATADNASPDHASNASGGSTAFQDPSGRYYFPSLYITNLTAHPLVNGTGAGDFQNLPVGTLPRNVSGGTPFVDDIFGTWTTANISGGTYTDTPPPAQNNWDLGSGSDTPVGTTFSAMGNEGYGAEVRWNVNHLTDSDGHPLVPGNLYRIQIITHDQNKTGGDAGEFCVTLSVPGITTVASNGTVGQPVTDQASISGLNGKSGNITWSVYNDDAGNTLACTQANLVTSLSPATHVTGDTSGLTSPAWTPTSAGNYQWHNPLGSITWVLYADNAGHNAACTTPITTVGPVAVDSSNNSGQAIQSPPWPANAAGDYKWVATFTPSDGNNVKVTSGCNDPVTGASVEPFTVGPLTPGMKITKLESFSSSSGFGPGPLSGDVGQRVYYRIALDNTGNTPLAISFSDPGCDPNTLSGPTLSVGSYDAQGNLNSGGEVDWTCSHVLTAADVAGYTNTAQASGTVADTGTNQDNTAAPCPNSCQASVVAYSSSPGMQVVKLQSLSAQGPFTTSQLTGSVGDTVYYEIQVTNTGNEPLTLSISDPHCDSAPAGPTAVSGSLSGNVLAPGGVAQYTCSHVLAASDMPSFTNVGTITGQPQCPPAANSCPPLSGTGIVVVNVTQANIQVLKLQSLSASGPFTTSQLTTSVGHTIYYEIQATNTGNAPLTLSITDPECDAGTLSGPVALTGSLSGNVLSPGGEAQYTCSHVLRSGDASPFTNTATVIGTPPSGPPVSGTSSVTAKKAAVLPIRLCRAPSGKVIRYHGTKKPRACKRISKPPKHIRGFTG
jgi:uncharacterized repeat protein (TIGR01451 family)